MSVGLGDRVGDHGRARVAGERRATGASRPGDGTTADRRRRRADGRRPRPVVPDTGVALLRTRLEGLRGRLGRVSVFHATAGSATVVMVLRSRPTAASAGVASVLMLVALLVVSRADAGTLPHPLRGKSISYGSFLESKALRGVDHYAVYLPPGYAGTRVRYPVVYFLHGLPASPRRRIAASAADRPRRGAVGPPGDPWSACRALGRATSIAEWRDWGPAGTGRPPRPSSFVHVIDERYRHDRRPCTARVLVGISAGGYGATLIARTTTLPSTR